MQKVTETTSTVFNKILIPVITTVLGATAIYFLGFNKKGGGRSDIENMLLTKETTIKAWKSFVTSQNIAHKNTASLSQEYGNRVTTAMNTSDAEWLDALADFESEILREADKTMKDINNILEEENEIDKDFVSMLYRSNDNLKDQTKKAKHFFEKLRNVIKGNGSLEEKKRRWIEEAQKFMIIGENVEARAATEAESISKILAERYNQAFDLNDLLVYMEYKNKKAEVQQLNPPVNPEQDPNNKIGANVNNNRPEDLGTPSPELIKYLSGEWNMKDGVLQLDASGAMYWRFDGKGYTSGTWTVADQMLRMDAINPDTKAKSLLICSITNRKPDAFTMTIMASSEKYEFKRAK